MRILLVHIYGRHGVYLAHALNENCELRRKRCHGRRTRSLSEEHLTLLLHGVQVVLQLIQLCHLSLQQQIGG